MTTAVLRIAEASVGQSKEKTQGSGDLAGAPGAVIGTTPQGLCISVSKRVWRVVSDAAREDGSPFASVRQRDLLTLFES